MPGTSERLVAESNRIERKLTTILAADVEGYGRLMAADEVAAMTLDQAREHRASP